MTLSNETEKEHVVSTEIVTPSHGSRGESFDDGVATEVVEVEQRKPLGSLKAFVGWLVLNFAV